MTANRFAKAITKEMKRYKAANLFLDFVKKNVYNAKRVGRLRLKRFPPEVWIENTNYCNASCIMCPRQKHTRRQGFMDFVLYERLIREIAQHKNMVERLHMHNYGEPLLDKDLSRKIRFAKTQGIKHTYFVTNAAALTADLSRMLIESGLDEFKISFYGTDKETYNRTMRGLDFDTTLGNVKDFFKVRSLLETKTPKVIIQYLPQESNRRKTDEFRRIFEPIIDSEAGDCLYVFSLHNYADGRNYCSTEGNINVTCNYLWRTMVILYDGMVVPCCMDYNGVQPVGDVRQNNIEQIWNGPILTEMRHDFKRLKYDRYPLCMQCNLTRW